MPLNNAIKFLTPDEVQLFAGFPAREGRQQRVSVFILTLNPAAVGVIPSLLYYP